MFQFTDKNRSIEICGKSYDFNAGDADTIVQFESAVKMLRDLGEVPKEDVGTFIFKAAETVEALLDGLFGKGAYEEIFSGRSVNIADMVELVNYIGQEIKSLGITESTQNLIEDMSVVADEPVSS